MATITSGAISSEPVAAAQPTAGGIAPARPPMTMFCEVARFRYTV